MLLLTFPESCGEAPVVDGDTPYRIYAVDEQTGNRRIIRCSKSEVVRLIEDLQQMVKVESSERR